MIGESYIPLQTYGQPFTGDYEGIHVNRYGLYYLKVVDCKIVEERMLTQDDLFERAMRRPSNYFKLSDERQWEIDKDLLILDWNGKMDKDQLKRFTEYFGLDLT